MKKLFTILFLTATMFVATAQVRAEKIDNFGVNIDIKKDASINVIEVVKMNFENEQKHGIFRDIPLVYKDKDGNSYSLQIDSVNILNEINEPYTWTEEQVGDNYELKIGDADVLVSGIKTYKIYYTIRGAINYFPDHDELYWNTTGNNWPFVIEKSTAAVVAPADLEKGKIKYKCYIGNPGSKEECPGRIVNATKTTERVVGFENKKKLDAGAGMTVVFSVPRGYIDEVDYRQPIIVEPFWLKMVKLFWPFSFTIVIFAFMFLRWFAVGRDPKGRETIIAQYDIPDNLMPAEIGTLIDADADNKDISAELIYLAIKGYLKISKEGGDYKLIKLKETDQDLNKYQTTLMTKIFNSQTEISLTSLKDKFYKDLKEIKTEVYDTVSARGYFTKSPEKVRKAYLGVATFLFIGSLFDFVYVGLFPLLAVSILIDAAIIGGFGWLMPARTTKGVLTREYILGLKRYLEVAESERIKFHNAPEKNPSTFEKFLPVAMVLDVEEQWAKQFADIYRQPPQWYNNPDMSNFNSYVLVHNMVAFSSEAHSILSSTPSSSASSGGSGFSGGSGGGFGGGGGGSW